MSSFLHCQIFSTQIWFNGSLGIFLICKDVLKAYFAALFIIYFYFIYIFNLLINSVRPYLPIPVTGLGGRKNNRKNAYI